MCGSSPRHSRHASQGEGARVALLSVALPRPYAHASNFVVSMLHARCVAWSVSASITFRPPRARHAFGAQLGITRNVIVQSLAFVGWLRKTIVAMGMRAPLVACRMSVWSNNVSRQCGAGCLPSYADHRHGPRWAKAVGLSHRTGPCLRKRSLCGTCSHLKVP